ncbi:NB-ARC domain-containing protein [Gloeocapsopsis sp. IPPAS B-1203]|uniref:NB-ARC domain-containing protein n=1 Tax=Gloeocapsopsis sp. IPPAS B-1203 TaxID=2049454 RepID=UPI0025A13749|nr:NB-ARC domain-containing protein [Gloeocapsopsis sp. IPPAS B-1203]
MHLSVGRRGELQFKKKLRERSPMDAEEALRLIDKLLPQQRLVDVQELVFRLTWQGLTYTEIAEQTNYEADYIKFVGFQLWQMLSKALGEKVSKSNFKSVLRRKVAEFKTSDLIGEQAKLATRTINHPQAIASSHCDWKEVIDVSVFYGRALELAKLQQWVTKDYCRLIAFVGVGGIGKTALAVKLAQRVQSQFEFVIWCSLRDAPPLSELLTTLIKFTSQQHEILPAVGNIPELIEYLQAFRCLLILDNFEAILSSNQCTSRYRPGYEEYGELLLQVGKVPHQSCLLLTSREKPIEIAALEDKCLPVRTLQVSGVRIGTGQEILVTKGLPSSVDETEQLIECYQGNPLALKIAATLILDLFDGKIADLLQQRTIALNSICNLLAHQIQRLSPLEEQVMYWLALNREPVLAAHLQADGVLAISRSHVIDTLESLSWRSLIEKSPAGFIQHSIVMEFTIEQFIKQVCVEIATGKIYLLNRYPLLKATAQDYVKKSQVRMILEPILSHLHSHFQSPAEIEQQLQEILTTLQTHCAESPGYGSVNIMNLLRQLQVAFSGDCVATLDLTLNL